MLELAGMGFGKPKLNRTRDLVSKSSKCFLISFFILAFGNARSLRPEGKSKYTGHRLLIWGPIGCTQKCQMSGNWCGMGRETG